MSGQDLKTGLLPGEPPDGAPICALLTANNRGAISVIGCLGNRISHRLDRLFRPANAQAFSRLEDVGVVYGRWISTGEDLVVVRDPEPALDGHEYLEIQCHGGQVASRSVLQELESVGAAVVTPLELHRQKCGPWKADSEWVLAHCITTRTANLAAHLLQLQPAALFELRQQLQRLSQSRHDTNEAQTIRSNLLSSIEHMLQWEPLTRLLNQPRSLVFCGQPNVGKSSLSNRLLGFERSIVHSTAGTTRDVVDHRTAIDGWPVELKDTAGLRSSQDRIESEGIRKAKLQIQQADLPIAVFEAQQPWGQPQQRLLDELTNPVVVFNKADLLIHSGGVDDKRPDGVYVSATTGLGIDDFVELLKRRLKTRFPSPDRWIPVSVSQCKWLEQIRSAVERNQFDTALTVLTRPEC